jgi:hypothetical protein
MSLAIIPWSKDQDHTIIRNEDPEHSAWPASSDPFRRGCYSGLIYVQSLCCSGPNMTPTDGWPGSLSNPQIHGTRVPDGGAVHIG